MPRKRDTKEKGDRHEPQLYHASLHSFFFIAAAQDLPLTGTSLTGTFVGGDANHEAAGSFEIATSEALHTLSLSEDFSVRRRPDLFMWLVRGDDVENRAVLGRLQSAGGAQTYEISDEVDLSQYDRVLVWCRTFRVLFASEFSAAE